MAIKANISSNMQVSSNQGYRQNSRISTTLTSGNGPSPGLVIVTPAGTDIDLSLLDSPSLTYIINLSLTETVEIGIWNVDQSEFYPVLRFGPGEGYPIRLSPNVLQEYATGTGTGTTGEQNTLRAKAMGTVDVPIRFDCFDG